MKIIAQMVVRNEEGRYLDRVIPRITEVVDRLIILDDASTDNTVKICRSFEKTIAYESKERRGLTDKSGLRGELWEHVRGLKPDWVLSIDADEVLDVNDSFDWNEVFLSDKNWFEVYFYEMWNEKQYRVDGYWSTTKPPIFRFQDCSFGWEKKLHCFGAPKSIFRKGDGGFLEGIKMQHLAYLKDEDKKRKYEFYMQQNLDDPVNLAHAKTILGRPELRDYDAEPRIKKPNLHGELKIVGQMIVRNEENRYLDLVIPKILNVVDKLVILDDASTDNTVNICRGFKKVIVYEGKERRWLTDESGLRGELWEHVREQKPDWVLSLDADEVLDINDSFNWSRVFSSEKDWFAVHFYEMWNKKQYRTDGRWSSVIMPIFRFQDCSFGWEQNFHCPRIFQSISREGGFLEGIKVRHLAYLKDEDKKKKSEFYCHQNLGGSLEHAETILDEPELRDYDIGLPSVTIASPIRNRSALLPQFLESLCQLNYPKDKLNYHFIVNDSTDEARTIEIIKSWGKKNRLTIAVEIMNFGTDDREHDWDDKKLAAMRIMRNKFLANLEDSDYLFEVDCGILFPDPDILWHLIGYGKDVISPVFWARWGDRQTRLLPNVWIRDGYELSETFLEGLKKPGIYQVGGLGAVTLISDKVWGRGVNYNRVTNLPRDMRGEDRDFCVRCNVHGIELWADSFYPITHLDSVPLKVNIYE